MDDNSLAVTTLLPSKKQTLWRWPAVINFVFGGAGAGAYIVGTVGLLSGKATAPSNASVPFGLLGPALALAGLVLLAAEAGRPLRGIFLFQRLHSAWISREILAFCLFILSAVLDFFSPHFLFKLLANASALVFILSQGFILSSARAIPVWNLAVIPMFFLTSGLSSGAGVVLLATAAGSRLAEPTLVPAALICTTLNLAVWILYLRAAQKSAFRPVIAVLRRPASLLSTVVLGAMLPILLLFLVSVSGHVNIDSRFGTVFGIASGMALIGGVWVQKTLIVLAAGFTHETLL